MPTESLVQFRTLDGLRLAGTFVTLDAYDHGKAVVLVHGGGVTREEGGFFDASLPLAVARIASLRFDLRGHGESEGANEKQLRLLPARILPGQLPCRAGRHHTVRQDALSACPAGPSCRLRRELCPENRRRPH
jgi:pimeloyl-ACP methyl ester carboxylesterase